MFMRDDKIKQANQLLSALLKDIEAYNAVASPVLAVRLKLAKLASPKSVADIRLKSTLEKQLASLNTKLETHEVKDIKKRIDKQIDKLSKLDKELGISCDRASPSFLEPRF